MDIQLPKFVPCYMIHRELACLPIVLMALLVPALQCYPCNVGIISARLDRKKGQYVNLS